MTEPLASSSTLSADPLTEEEFANRLKQEDEQLSKRTSEAMDAYLRDLPNEDDPSLSNEQREYVKKFRQLLRHQLESFNRKVADRNRAYLAKYQELHASSATHR